MLDIKITNAKTRKTGKELVEIGIENGKITAIASSVEGEAKQIIDAKGKLVTESFVNGHLHLCKVYTLEMAGQDALKEYNDNNMGGAMTSIERAADFKACYDEKWIIENVRKACNLAVKYGNTHIRAFADVDSKARLEGVKAVIRGREEYKDRLDIQVVAFPQDGVAIGLAAMGARTLGGETGNFLETVILASSVLYELIGPACAKLSLYLSKSYSNKLEEIVEIPEEEEAEQKTELELLIQRIQAIQEELPKHDDPFYEDEKAFSEAAEEHCFQFNEEH